MPNSAYFVWYHTRYSNRYGWSSPYVHLVTMPRNQHKFSFTKTESVKIERLLSTKSMAVEARRIQAVCTNEEKKNAERSMQSLN